MAKPCFYIDGKYLTNDEMIDWASKVDFSRIGKILPQFSHPETPFRKTDQWVNLAARRMIRYAAENGFDRIAWTTGEQQADRYNLAKQVDRIVVDEDGGRYTVMARPLGKADLEEITVATKENLSDYIGKELATKAINDGGGDFSGDDLKVGGSGMKAFYDAIVPSAMSKLGKPFGAKVENISIKQKDNGFTLTLKDNNGNVTTNQFDSKAKAYLWLTNAVNNGSKYEVISEEDGATLSLQQSIPVTDSMKETAMAGMPLFAPTQILLNFTPEETKDETEKAYGSEEKQQEAIDKTIAEAEKLQIKENAGLIANRRPEFNSPVLSKRTVLDSFKESGYVDFIGQRVNTHQDIADMWSIHRSPYIEKGHVIFLNDNNEIVGTIATTANHASQTRLAQPNEIIEHARKLGATSVYLLHNHPSGNAVHSSQDVRSTVGYNEVLSKAGIEIKGHVIVDHDKYTFIDATKISTDYDWENITEGSDGLKTLENTPGIITLNKYGKPQTQLFTEREVVGRGQDAPERLFEIGKNLLSQPTYKAAIIYLQTTPELGFNIAAYDIIPEGATKKDIIRIANEGIKNNLGVNAVITHDGSFGERFWSGLNSRIVDVINTNTGSHFFDTVHHPLENETLWAHQIIGEYGARNLDKAEEATTRLDNLAVAKEMDSNKKIKSPENIEEYINVLEQKTGLKFIKSRNSNSYYYNNAPIIKIRISDHPSKFYEKQKGTAKKLMDMHYSLDVNAVANRINGTLFNAYKKGDKLIHSSDKVGEVTFIEYYPEKEAVKVLNKEGEEKIYFEEKFFNSEYKPKQFTPSEIRLATGWERGVDGLWRYETGDFKLKDGFENKFKTVADEVNLKALPLSEIIDSEELFTEYPSLKGVEVLSRNNGSADASWNNATKTITMNTGMLHSLQIERETKELEQQYREKYRSTLIHEIQHAIQDIEGFAIGGSVNHLSDSELYSKAKENNLIGKGFTDEEIRYELYKRIAGEVEARNATRRMNMTAEERRNSLLAETEDVAREDQIFIYDGVLMQAYAESELDRIKEQAIKDGTFMKAPNGKSTKLNEKQWLQVRTKAFKKWFGDWENDPKNASKVVDANGEPMVVYHGTNAEFNEFKPTEPNFYQETEGWYFFTDKKESAQMFGENVMPVFLNITNPTYETQGRFNTWNLYDDKGNYGFIAPNTDTGNGGIVNQYVVENSNQIKSADPVTYDDEGNVIPLSKRFNKRSDDIRYSVANTNQEIFVSNAARAVEGIKQEKATPEQWLKMIEKNGGLKAGEDKWLGLSDWLKGSSAKTLAKQDVLDFINENAIKIEETRYTEAPKSQNDRSSLTIDEVPESMREGMNTLNEEYKTRVATERKDPNSTVWGARNAAFDYMVDKYDGKFADAFGIRGENLTVRNAGQLKNAAEILGVEVDETINPTRLNYTTEGLDNKREIALVVPTIEPWNEGDEIHFGDAGEGRAVAWVRFGETTDADGKRVLVIDEIQSNRHQEGREKGYKKGIKEDVRKANEATVDAQIHYDTYISDLAEKYNCDRADVYAHATDAEIEEAEARMNAVSSTMREYERIYEEANGIPQAPFEKNWQELAMKRMLRLAAEEGYDKVAWTTGEQQADRYNLGKIYSSIEREDSPYSKAHPEEGRRFVFGGNNVDTFFVDDNGKVIDSTVSEAIGKDLSEVVGKDMAEKIMSMENGDVLDEEDMRIGGEGMKGFYDKMLPSFMNKYGKQWGVKVGEVMMPNLEEGYQTMHSVDVTDQMKEDVMEGQPMFSVKNSAQNENDNQLSLFLQNNSGEYETQDGQTIGFANLLNGTDTANDSGSRPSGVQREDGRTNPTDYHLRKLEDGEVCHAERRYQESKQFDFTGSEKIESADDVAYIFKQLENAAIENAFVVLIKDGKPTVIHVGIGTYASTVANINNAMVAYQQLNPDQVYFVHNHPSGKIKCSNSDVDVYKKAKQLFRDRLQPGIIIDTTSGKYGLFTDTTEVEGNMPTEGVNETPINTYSFSKQVFEEGWNPNNVYPIRSSEDAATFISSHRLGEHKKMSVLILTPQNNIIGNVFLPYTSLKEAPKGIDFANEIGYYINQMGGVSAVLYGSFRFDEPTIERLKEVKQGLIAQDLNLTDAIYVSTNNVVYNSANYRGYLRLNEYEEAYGETNDPVLYSVTRAANTPQERMELYDALTGVKNDASSFAGRITESFYESVVDGVVPLKRLQDVIAGRGKVTDAENAYLMEIARAARAVRLRDESEAQYTQPMMDAIAALTGRQDRKGFDREMRDVELYVIAKSGLERNEWFWNKAKKDDPNAELKDKSGLTSLAAQFGRDDFTQLAQELVDRYESHKGQAKTDALWKAIKDMSHNLLDIEADGHLISRNLHDELYDRWQYYVPLRGFDETTTSSQYSYEPSSANIRFENPYKKIKGRVSLADNPFVNLIRMTESAINMKCKNEVGLALLTLAADHPDNGLLRVGQAWEVKKIDPNTGDEVWEAAYPQLNGLTNAQIPKAIDAFQKAMQREAKVGNARPSNRTAGGIRIHPKDMDDHVLKVKVGGETVDLYLLGNPKAFQCLNPKGKSALGEKMSGMTRALSGLMTTYNPVFMVRNSIRDLKTAVFITYSRDGAVATARMLGQWFGNMNNLRKLIAGKSSGDAKIDQYWQEFLEFGGETGFTRTLNMEKQKADFMKAMRQATRDKAGQTLNKVANFYSDWMKDYGNRFAEDITRFAVYCSSRDMGKSAMQAASDAKNTTANFNKKGQSAFARFMSTNFAFFNAAFQGLNTSFHAFKDNPGRASIAAAATMVYSMAIPFVNLCLLALFGDDDDWRQYENMTQFVSNTHAVLYMPGAGFITLPYAQDFVPFTSLGNIIWRNATGMEKVANGRSTWANIMLQWSDTWADLLPVNAFEEGFGEIKDWKGVARAIAPTWLSPVADVMLNRNFMGSEIRHKHWSYNNDIKDLKPYWAEYDRNKSEWAYLMARFIAGGDEYRAGAEWRNVDPRQLIHIVEGYGGGTVKLASDAINYFVAKAKGEETSLNQSPFIKKFWIEPNPDKYEGNLNGKIYELSKHQREMEADLKALQKEADKALEDGNEKAYNERVKKMEAITSSPDYQVLSKYDLTQTTKDWKEQRNAILNDEELSDEGKQDAIRELTYNKASLLDAIWQDMFNGEGGKSNWFSRFYEDASTEAYTHNRKKGETE